MSIDEQLIEIYSRQDADNVGNDPEYVALRDAHDNLNDPFNSHRNRIEKIKRDLEAQVAIQPTYQGQASYALKLFMRLVDGSRNQEDEVCRLLTLRTFYPSWSDNQQKYYDETCIRMRSGSDYFISFTQRNRVALGKSKEDHFANPVNSYHRYLIRIGGPLPDPIDAPDNQLALMIHRILSQKFDGFFFPDHQGDSQVVSKKLSDAIQQCLVFIQVVQNEMFDKAFDGMPNYCYDEYREALAANKERVFVFATGEWPYAFIPDVDVLYALDDWYQFVRKIDPLSVKTTQFSDTSPEIEIGVKKITRLLVDKVERCRTALWEQAPPDL